MEGEDDHKQDRYMDDIRTVLMARKDGDAMVMAWTGAMSGRKKTKRLENQRNQEQID